MAYIDKSHYDSVFKGVPIDDADTFSRLSERATDIVNQITNYVLIGVEFNRLAQVIQDNVKKAVASQVEYMFQNGGETLIHGNSASSVSIGSFSYQEKAEGLGIVSPIVIEYLKPLGLLYSGLNVHG